MRSMTVSIRMVSQYLGLIHDRVVHAEKALLEEEKSQTEWKDLHDDETACIPAEEAQVAIEKMQHQLHSSGAKGCQEVARTKEENNESEQHLYATLSSSSSSCVSASCSSSLPRVRKFLYHAFHYLLDANRLVCGIAPRVVSTGKERSLQKTSCESERNEDKRKQVGRRKKRMRYC